MSRTRVGVLAAVLYVSTVIGANWLVQHFGVRFKYAAAIGCDSADGTFLAFGPDVNLPRLMAWLRTDDQYTTEMTL